MPSTWKIAATPEIGIFATPPHFNREGATMRCLLTAICLTFLLLGLPGCSRDSADRDQPPGTATAERALAIKGSDTMVHLVSAWAEEFMKLHPAVELSVTGGGSGTGIAGLINGTTDLCAASRKINEKESALAGARNITPVEFTVALDGIAVIVHPHNQLTALALAQLRDIFTGKISNWREVGGPDLPLLVFSRESSSGTYVFFQEHVMDRQDYTARARLLPGTSALVQAVAADRGAIGYVGLGYAEEAAKKVKVLGIRSGTGGGAVTPSGQSVSDGSYPIARPLFLYSPGAARGTARTFVDFALSAAGQRIVADAGYVPISR
jgi:phosphate transport system substrate-binding protein